MPCTALGCPGSSGVPLGVIRGALGGHLGCPWGAIWGAHTVRAWARTAANEANSVNPANRANLANVVNQTWVVSSGARCADNYATGTYARGQGYDRREGPDRSAACSGPRGGYIEVGAGAPPRSP
jgi:hypothetical protein